MKMPYTTEIEEQMKRLYGSLNEKDRRRYAAIEAVKLGWGGMSYISNLFGCDYYVLRLGKAELLDDEAMKMKGIRLQGGGRKSALATIEGIDEAFLRVLSKHTAGSPMDETVKWTNLTRKEISELLKEEGIEVSVTVVDQLLDKHNYRQRKAQKRLSSGRHPQQNEQFENIEELIESYKAAGEPVISMDTKKKNS
jgi:Rhodopirellula transposase DDE domain